MGFSGSLSFPANPVKGQTYDHVGKSYQWQGLGWRRTVQPGGAASPPSGFLLLASGAQVSIATLDIVLRTELTSRFRSFQVLLSKLLPATDGAALWCRFSTDGGATYDAAAASYGWGAAVKLADVAAAAASGSGSTTQIELTTATIGNGAAEGYGGLVELFDPVNAALWNRISHQGVWVNNAATPAIQTATGEGHREAAQDTDAIRFLCSSGNIASVEWALYGFV